MWVCIGCGLSRNRSKPIYKFNTTLLWQRGRGGVKPYCTPTTYDKEGGGCQTILYPHYLRQRGRGVSNHTVPPLPSTKREGGGVKPYCTPTTFDKEGGGGGVKPYCTPTTFDKEGGGVKPYWISRHLRPFPSPPLPKYPAGHAHHLPAAHRPWKSRQWSLTVTVYNSSSASNRPTYLQITVQIKSTT